MRYKDKEIYQTPGEVKSLRAELKEIKDLDGVVAEVGVYEGASAAVIREELPDKELYLFDTFSGFPNNLHESDPKHYKIGDCLAPKKHVEELFRGDKNVFITEGKFPETSGIIKDKKFSFAHIDTDIYQSTKDSLEFFLPRMTRGGVIVVHDYPAHSGVKKAVDEFKFEYIKVGAEGRQCIIKIK